MTRPDDRDLADIAELITGDRDARPAVGLRPIAGSPESGDGPLPDRQVCRRCLRSSAPAVTLTFDNGARRLHWCAEHASDADNYRESADRGDEQPPAPQADHSYMAELQREAYDH